MKIAYVYDVIYPETIGGVEKRIHEIGIRLAGMGHEVHLYGMKYGPGPDTVTRDGLIIHGVCPAVSLYTQGRRSIMQAIRYTLALIPHLLHSDAEIIDCQNFPYLTVPVACLAARLKGQVFLVTWHEFWGRYWYEYLGPAGLLGLGAERIALWCSGRAAAVSPHTAELMARAGYRDQPRIIPNGIDLVYIRSVPPSQARSDLVFAGRFIPEKHPGLVVETVRELRKTIPDIRCIMIGDGPLAGEVREMIVSEGLSEHITCTGFIADHAEIMALMKASRVFILPSEREGFGIAALEAMACGLPLVTIDHPRNAASAHVIPGCGSVTRMDPHTLAEGVRSCLAGGFDPDALASYATSHDWDRIAAEISAWYRSP